MVLPYTEEDRRACYLALCGAENQQLALLLPTDTQRLLKAGLFTAVNPSERDPLADGTYALTPEGESLGQEYKTQLLAEKVADLEAKLAGTTLTLQLIAQYGTTTLESDEGPVSCNGAWCASQAQWALDSLLENDTADESPNHQNP